MSENIKDNSENTQSDDGVTLDLDFAPAWARQSPDDQMKRFRDTDYSDAPRERGGKRFDDGGFRGNNRRDDRDSSMRSRKPRRDFERSAPRGDGESRPSTPRAPQSNFSSNAGGQRPYRAPQQSLPPLPIEVRVLPEHRVLGAVIRRMMTSHRAFPLRDIVLLFLENPASCLIRVASNKEQSVPFFQCKVCGLPALTQDEIITHALNYHMQDFFDVEEVDCEPPSGSFVVVAKCGLSGVLLGPPNHHSFNAKVQEVLRTSYPNMSEETYRSRIVMVRDPEVVEQWRQSCTKKQIFRRKGAASPVADIPAEPPVEGAEGVAAEPPPKAPALEREQAEMIFKREILPGLIGTPKTFVCSATVAVKTPSRQLYYAFNDALKNERHYPASLYFALRGAMRNRKFYSFRANVDRGQEFIMAAAPEPLDTEHAVSSWCDIVDYVTAHPACVKNDMLAALAGDDADKAKALLTDLACLIEKKHIIAFYNDVLAIPAKNPVFRCLPSEQIAGRKNEIAKAAITEQPQAPVEESPVAEPPAAESVSAEAAPDVAPVTTDAAQTQAE